MKKKNEINIGKIKKYVLLILFLFVASCGGVKDDDVLSIPPMLRENQK